MIAELFYPKELKEIIRKLEDEDNLHREPLWLFDREIVIFLFVAIVTVLTIISDGEVVFGSLCLILLALLLRSFVKSKIKRFKAYVFGDRYEVVIKRIIRNKKIYCYRSADPSESIVVWPQGYFMDDM